MIENSYGILRARWRIFSKPRKANVENVKTMYVLQYVSIITYVSWKMRLIHLQDLLTVGVVQETLEIAIDEKFVQQAIWIFKN